MTTSSFLAVAGARADSLRKLSHNLRSLNWATASLDEVEHEVPELEVAMTVFRRLTTDAGGLSDANDPENFLEIAGGRADHLRQVTQEMRSLDWVHASLTDIENEVPEIELTMSVYQRLVGEADTASRPSAKPATTPAPASVGAGSAFEDANVESSSTPTFSEFAKQSLEPRSGRTRELADVNGNQQTARR